MATAIEAGSIAAGSRGRPHTLGVWKTLRRDAAVLCYWPLRHLLANGFSRRGLCLFRRHLTEFGSAQRFALGLVVSSPAA